MTAFVKVHRKCCFNASII